MVAVAADQILRAVERQYHGGPLDGQGWAFYVNVKTGPTTAHTGLAAGSGPLAVLDGLALRRSWARPDLVGFEVKVSRADFLRDQKWPLYLAVTHRFYFVCPSGVIQPADLDPRVGLLWYSPETGGLLTRKKALYRAIELPVHLLYYLALSQREPVRHPFFSNRRAFLERWVEDREARQDLGYRVETKLVALLRDAEEGRRDAEARAERAAADAARWSEVWQVLVALGVCRKWDVERTWEQGLRAALARGLPPAVVGTVQRVVAAAEELGALLGTR